MGGGTFSTEKYCEVLGKKTPPKKINKLQMNGFKNPSPFPVAHFFEGFQVEISGGLHFFPTIMEVENCPFWRLNSSPRDLFSTSMFMGGRAILDYIQ